MGMQPLGFDGKLDNHWDSPWHKPRFVYVTMSLTMLTGKLSIGTHDIYDIYDIYNIYIHEWLTGWAYFSVKQLLVDNQIQFCSHKLALSRFPVTVVVRPFGKPMFWNPLKNPNHRSYPFLDPCAPVQRIVYAIIDIWAIYDIYDIYGISMILFMGYLWYLWYALANWGWFLTSFWRKTWIWCPHSLRSSKLLRSPFFVANVDHCGPISIVISLETTGWFKHV
jgi:hypothetical protein